MNALRAIAWPIGGALLVALGAQVALPMVPVPTTLQTFAVVVFALWRGPVGGSLSAALYLGLVVAGLPVLSSGQASGGRAFVELVSAGYVVGFVPAAALVGWLGQRPSFGRWLVAGLLGHAVVLASGTVVLALHVGWSSAIEHGLRPFLLGALAKSAIAAASVVARQLLCDPTVSAAGERP